MIPENHLDTETVVDEVADSGHEITIASDEY